MDDVEAAFAAAIVWTTEIFIVNPPQERRKPGRAWSGDAQTKAELHAATDAIHAVWQRLKMDTITQLIGMRSGGGGVGASGMYVTS